MGERPGADQPLVHVGLPGELLDIAIGAHRHEALAPAVAGVPHRLHDPEDPEHPAMQAQEIAAGPAQHRGIAGGEEGARGLRRDPPAGHGIVDPLARGRRDDPGGVAGHQQVAPVVPAAQGLERDRRALAAQRLAAGEAALVAHGLDRAAQREALVCAAHPDARRLTMGEDPAVEIGRQPALVDHIAARTVEARAMAAGGRRLGRANHLVIGEDAGVALGPGHIAAGHGGPGPVGPDHQPGAHALQRSAARRAVAHHGAGQAIMLDPFEAAGAPLGPGGGGAGAQPLVEHLAIDHADIAGLAHRHVDRAVRGGDHARRPGPGDEQALRHLELLEQPRRHGPAAGLDPPGPVEQQHAVAGAGKIPGRRGATGAAAHHHDIEVDLPRPRPTGRREG